MSQNDDEMQYNEGSRFNIPDRLRQYQSRYDMPSELIQDIQQRAVRPFTKYVLDLATAQAVTDPWVLSVPGRGFVIFGYTAATELTTKTLAASALVNVGVENPSTQTTWTAKHNRGFRGDFTKLFLSWPAQTGNKCEFYVFHYDEQTYSTGEAAT